MSTLQAFEIVYETVSKILIVYLGSLELIPQSTIAPAAIDEISLGRRRAHTSTIAAQSSTAARRLALVVLKNKEIVGAYLIHIRAGQRLVWRCSTWNTQCYREESRLCQIVQEGSKLTCSTWNNVLGR